jgi:alpha-1,3-mannosyltransferase
MALAYVSRADELDKDAFSFWRSARDTVRPSPAYLATCEESQAVTGSPRILHLCRRYVPFAGGTERYVRDLATAQARLGRSVTVLTLDRDVVGGAGTRLPAVETIDGVRVRRVPGVGSRRTALALRPDVIRREIRDHDVIHLHDLRFAVGLTALLASLAHRPLLVHTHGLIFHEARLLGLKRAVMRTYYGPFLRLAAAVIASSESDRAMLIRLVPALASRTLVLENAIPVEPLLHVERRPVAGRLLVLGRVAPSKGNDDLIGALARLELPWRLVVAGEAPDSEVTRLRARAEASGVNDRVEIRGAFGDADLPDLLASAAAAVFPSRAEGFGLALLEAMAAGVPLVARSIPAHAELLGPDLRDRLVEFGSSGAVAAAVAGLLTLGPADVAALSSRLRARAAGYDISRLVAQIDDAYRRLGISVSGGAAAG